MITKTVQALWKSAELDPDFEARAREVFKTLRDNDIRLRNGRFKPKDANKLKDIPQFIPLRKNDIPDAIWHKMLKTTPYFNFANTRILGFTPESLAHVNERHLTSGGAKPGRHPDMRPISDEAFFDYMRALDADLDSMQPKVTHSLNRLRGGKGTPRVNDVLKIPVSSHMNSNITSLVVPVMPNQQGIKIITTYDESDGSHNFMLSSNRLIDNVGYRNDAELQDHIKYTNDRGKHILIRPVVSTNETLLDLYKRGLIPEADLRKDTYINNRNKPVFSLGGRKIYNKMMKKIRKYTANGDLVQ